MTPGDVLVQKTPRRAVVAISGGTGYLGRALIPVLLSRGHRVRAMVRPGSERKIPAGVELISGDPLNKENVRSLLAGADTLVHLVGVPEPSPAMAREFREIDLASIQVAVGALTETEPRPRLVYLSVAQPAPVMKAYVAARAEGEALIRAHHLDATCLRPWYVLGPGHRWPMVLIPIYAALRWIPATRASAERLGLVTLPQMIRAIMRAVENRERGMHIVEVPEIQRSDAAGR